MKLKILQLNNYKSFFDSGQLSLEPGFIWSLEPIMLARQLFSRQ